MKTLRLQQGSDSWHAARANHFTASEAPVMMGASKYMNRSDLIKQKATGIVPEVTPELQRLYDKGHASEAAARPIAEAFLSEELFPATGVDDDDYLLASFDGISMMGGVCWEHKLWSKERSNLAASGDVREDDMIQIQQQLLVSGAEKCLFTVSDGTTDKCLHVMVEPDTAIQSAILAGWKQFEEDVANYAHKEAVVEVAGKAPESLPSLHIEVTGMVTSSNLQEFKDHAIQVFQNINTKLETDEDFADAAKTVKWCGDVEKKLDAAKNHALSQTASIDELFSAIDEIKEEARVKRLELNKLVETRKKAVREEICLSTISKFTEHVNQLKESLEGLLFPRIEIDVAGAIKGKKTISSLRDAADTELAICKIKANEVATKMTKNLSIIKEFGCNHEFLFSDKNQLVLKDSDDLAEIVKARVVSHEAQEKAKEDKQREEIRKEEQEKLNTTAATVTETSEPVAQEHKQKARPRKAPGLASMPEKIERPTDTEIISVLAGFYQVPNDTVIAWLSVMNFEQIGLSVAASQ